jgi:hypothetical protein
MTFGKELFQHIAAIVPYWRVSDGAWNIGGNEYLAGIEVLRNYSGSVMVIPWEDERRQELVELRGPGSSVDLQRVLVVVDDRTVASWQAIETELAPIRVLPWSHRDKLVATVVKDAP